MEKDVREFLAKHPPEIHDLALAVRETIRAVALDDLIEGRGKDLRRVRVRATGDARPRGLRAPVKAARAGSAAKGEEAKAETAGRERAAGMSSEAVAAKTGKTWPEWFRLLDAAGAMEMTHKEIVALLAGEHGLEPWWQQMVTVAYERDRGKRAKHEKPEGFEVGASKTVAAPLADLDRAWSDASRRARWLADPAFTVRKVTPRKSMRITWVDGKSHVDVTFYPKGDAKSVVQVQHGKLASAAAAERMKRYWKAQLESLKAYLAR